jgi:hypothetical protein
MIRINRHDPPEEDRVMHFDLMEMGIIWSSLEFLTQVQDPEDRPEHEKKELKRKLVPFFKLKNKIKEHLIFCGKEFPDEDIH